jgi:hypothetical protein
MKTLGTKERRRGTRKNVKSGIVALMQPNNSVEIGNIIDVSEGGLSFFSTDCHVRMKQSLNMDILVIDKNIFLEGIKSELVSDTVTEDFPGSRNHQIINRYGVKFDNLQNFQLRQLKKIIP